MRADFITTALLFYFVLLTNIFSVTVTPLFDTIVYSKKSDGIAPFSGSSSTVKIPAGTKMDLISETPTATPFSGDILGIEVLEGAFKGVTGYILEEFIVPYKGDDDVIFVTNKEIKTDYGVLKKGTVLIFNGALTAGNSFSIALSDPVTNAILYTNDLSAVHYYIDISSENDFVIKTGRIIRVLDTITLLPVVNAGNTEYKTDKSGYIYLPDRKIEKLTISKDGYDDSSFVTDKPISVVYLRPVVKKSLLFYPPSTGLLSIPIMQGKIVAAAGFIVDSVLPDIPEGSDIYFFNPDVSGRILDSFPAAKDTSIKNGAFICVKHPQISKEFVVTNKNEMLSDAILFRQDGVCYTVGNTPVSIFEGMYDIFYESVAGVTDHETVYINRDCDLDEILKYKENNNYNVGNPYIIGENGRYKLNYYFDPIEKKTLDHTNDEVIIEINDDRFTIIYKEISYYAVATTDGNTQFIIFKGSSDYGISSTNFLSILSINVVFDNQFGVLVINIKNHRELKQLSVNAVQSSHQIPRLFFERGKKLYFEKIGSTL